MPRTATCGLLVAAPAVEGDDGGGHAVASRSSVVAVVWRREERASRSEGAIEWLFRPLEPATECRFGTREPAIEWLFRASSARVSLPSRRLRAWIGHTGLRPCSPF